MPGAGDAPGVGERSRPSEVRDPAGNTPRFTQETVNYLSELPARRLDAEWHEQNRGRYETHVHAPMSALLAAVRDEYISPISPEVAGGRRQLSTLRKNGYGRGGFHDHCRFAFYDPAVPAKARSPQLYFHLDGSAGTFEYGIGIGTECEEYVQRLRKSVRDAPDAVSEYLASAPEGTTVVRQTKDHTREWLAAEWCGLVRCDAATALGSGTVAGGLQLTQFAIRRVLPLGRLVELDGTLPNQVGEFLAWAWPFFEASRTGNWPQGVGDDLLATARSRAEGSIEADDDAARTLEELAERTSLPLSQLRDMEDALLAQHQVVLTGPPGTSKTFVARQFARYFARQRHDRPQGVTHALYMHASWAYEDFFEGLRPVERDGRLVFENRPGQFLNWVRDALRGHHPAARHVLVLDELNRCDTAAVLGELLQLLEYRGETVPLLSGRPFVFPANLYLIGTMNSADRSVGRIDLALRRRFFWIDLHPQPEVLRRWLARPDNNPVGFDADALRAVNELLAQHGVPPEQQVGHALFMGCGGGESRGGEAPLDAPLTEKRLRQVVQFGVLPYVRELLREQMLTHGRDEVLARVESLLLDGTDRRLTA